MLLLLQYFKRTANNLEIMNMPSIRFDQLGLLSVFTLSKKSALDPSFILIKVGNTTAVKRGADVRPEKVRFKKSAEVWEQHGLTVSFDGFLLGLSHDAFPEVPESSATGESESDRMTYISTNAMTTSMQDKEADDLVKALEKVPDAIANNKKLPMTKVQKKALPKKDPGKKVAKKALPKKTSKN